MQDRGAGFTIVELVVVLSIIGMLMALLLPAVMMSREAGRRATCANNLKNIGLAVINSDGARGRLPASGNFSVGGVGYHNWVVDILPYLERTDIHSLWRFDLPASNAKNLPLTRVPISVMVCPDDDTAVPGEGNLSYVVNGGFGWTQPVDCPVVMHVPSANNLQVVPIDLNGNGVTCPTGSTLDGAPTDKSLYFLTGLFFPENWPLGGVTVRHRSLAAVSDGLSRTLMLTENLRAGYDPTVGSTWASPLPWRCCFFLSAYVCDNAKCSPGHVDWKRANERKLLECINPSQALPEGEAPWPSSNHPGGVNAVYCDGHLQFLSEDVDGAVYGALVTPDGLKIHGPLFQPPMDDLQ
ncbi:MAG TPA: DUF1559 domain-containing protein [Pirellulales bacterium]